MPRVFDVILAACLLVFLAPALLAIAGLIRCTDAGPVLFRQTRVGRDGRHFTMIKFRSLRADGKPTAIGPFLRRYSLDELPEFWNVIRGDMALVGPRPMIVADQPKLDRVRVIRQRLRPGITGWAQINGRNALTFEQTFRLDLWYGRNRSVWLDLYILAATLPCVISAQGACALAPTARPTSKRRRKPAPIAT